MEIQIDAEFKALIPPLAPDELAQLEANILRDGCRDPLVVWDGILIDGHNRHEICTKHNIRFETVSMFFEDRDAAMDWMDANQLGRRNLQPQQASVLRGRIYNRRKKAAHRPEKGDQNDPVIPQRTAEVIAKETGVSPATIKRDGKLAEEVETDPELLAALNDRTEFKKVKRAKKEKKRESRRQQNRKKIESAPEPEKIIETGVKFATIVIDPPWDWGDEGDQDQMGRARPDYATMSKEQLMALPVGELADEDCHLYMWITNRSLPKGFELLERWGFRYITALTWAKPSFGMGNYFRGQTEHVLFGVKGSQPLKRKDVGTLFAAPRGPNGHSSKPVEFYDLVESCSPGPFLEMFSRSKRDGWLAWGEGSK
jgi:N6-adenosine-specific RNA methylase IME4